MPSADDYAAWIVQNADKKGTPEFATVANAYQEAKAQEFGSAALTADASAADKEALDPSKGSGTLRIPNPMSGFTGSFEVPVPEWLQRAASGAGSVVAGIPLAIKQAATDSMNAPTLLSMVTGKNLPQLVSGQPGGQPFADQAQALNAEALQKQQTDAPLMATTAGQAGAIGMKALPALALSPSIPAAATYAAVQRGLEPTTADESRAQNMVVSGALGAGGQAVANGIGAVVNGAQVSPDALKRAAIEWAQDNGIPLTRGQMTDSWMAKSLENWFSKLPGSQKFYRDTAAAQQSAIDRIINAHTMEGDAGQALQTAGAGRQWISDAQTVDAAQAMPGQFTLAPRQPTDALNTAARYFGKAADAETPATAMVGGREMPVNDAIAAAMQSISPGKGPLLPEGTSIPMVGPKGDYNNYQAIRSQLTKAASDQSVGTANQTAFQDLRGIFDQTAERSLAAQGADPQMLAKIRAAYTIDKTLLPAGTVLPDGTMSYSLPRITNIINAAVKDGTLPPSIAPDLVNVADFGRSIKSVTSSNTAEHGVSGAIATGGLLGHAAGGGEAASSIIKALLGLIAVPWGMSALMQGTRMGIPGLRNIPTETLGRLGMGLYGQAPDVARTVAGAMPSATTGQ